MPYLQRKVYSTKMSHGITRNTRKTAKEYIIIEAQEPCQTLSKIGTTIATLHGTLCEVWNKYSQCVFSQ